MSGGIKRTTALSATKQSVGDMRRLPRVRRTTGKNGSPIHKPLRNRRKK